MVRKALGLMEMGPSEAIQGELQGESLWVPMLRFLHKMAPVSTCIYILSICLWCFVGSSAPDAESEGPSFVERLLGNVLKNIEVSISNIHLRYEDWLTKPGTTFATGLTLKEFTIHVYMLENFSIRSTEVIKIRSSSYTLVTCDLWDKAETYT